MNNDGIRKPQTARRTALIACVAALGMALTIAPAQAQVAPPATVVPPPVPANLEVPAPNESFLLGRGIGTQNYVCQPGRSLGQVEWSLFTPQATLFSSEGTQLTTHFFGPNPIENSLVVRAAWQDSVDTSTVWGQVTASSADPNFVAPGAIPWLLVQVVGAQAGPTGGTTLLSTTFIQRLNTVGGVAPSTGCDRPKDIGRRAFVPYEADYFFFGMPSD